MARWIDGKYVIGCGICQLTCLCCRDMAATCCEKEPQEEEREMKSERTPD